MSSYFQNGNDSEQRDRKLSGFSRRNAVEQFDENGRESKKRGKLVLATQGKNLWVSLGVDILLLALVIGLGFAVIHGYRALRDIYAPEWEVREVVFRVKMENIPPDMVRYDETKGTLAIEGRPMWSSDQTDADMLGTVESVRTATVTAEGGETVLTMYLDVRANAYYRKGKGYRMGETMLLAGSTGTYRLAGMSAEGMIISVSEAAEAPENNG